MQFLINKRLPYLVLMEKLYFKIILLDIQFFSTYKQRETKNSEKQFFLKQSNIIILCVMKQLESTVAAPEIEKTAQRAFPRTPSDLHSSFDLHPYKDRDRPAGDGGIRMKRLLSPSS